MTTPATTAPAFPIFGEFPTSIEDRRYAHFGLHVEDSQERRRFVAEFDVFAGEDIDGGSLVTILNAPDAGRQAQSTIAFLGKHLRDDDGVPGDWTTPTVPEEDPDRPGEWLTNEAGDELYRWHDDSLVTRDELSALERDYDPIADASSRRRFAYLSSSERYRYQFAAIEELAKFMTKDVVGRPTRPQVPSGRGPQSTGRGSGGRSTARRR